jgi:hypothetical protein
MIYRRIAFPLVIALCAAFCVSCGDSSLTRTADGGVAADAGADGASDAPSGPGGTAAVTRFAGQTLQVHCEKLFECCSGEELEDIMGARSESVEDCAASASAVFSAIAFGEYDRAVDEERVIFDADAAQLCVDSWGGRSCGELSAANIFSTDLPGCREAVSGTVELGSSCVADMDCKVGHCRSDAEDNSTCQRLPQAGQPCPELRCAEDAYCSTFGEQYTCEAKRELEQGCQLARDCKSGVCAEGPDGYLVCQTKPLLCEGS